MELQLWPWRLSLFHVLWVKQLSSWVHALLLQEPLHKMGVTFKRLRQNAVKREEGFRSFGEDSCANWPTSSTWICTCDCTLNHPELQMGSLKHTCSGHSLLGVPKGVQRAAIAISMPTVWNGCWGGSFIKPHSPIPSQTELVNSTPPGLVLFIKPTYMSFVQGQMDFSLGVLNISVIFTFITREDLILELSLPPPPPYKYSLSTH